MVFVCVVVGLWLGWVVRGWDFVGFFVLVSVFYVVLCFCVCGFVLLFDCLVVGGFRVLFVVVVWGFVWLVFSWFLGFLCVVVCFCFRFVVLFFVVCLVLLCWLCLLDLLLFFCLWLWDFCFVLLYGVV